MKKVLFLSTAMAFVLAVAFCGYSASAAPYVKGSAPDIQNEHQQIEAHAVSSGDGQCAAKSGACCEAKGKDKAKGDCASCKTKSGAKEHKHTDAK